MRYPLSAAVLAVSVIALLALNMMIGSVYIAPSTVIDILMGEERGAYSFIILGSRLPAAVTALLTGASLAVCGLLLQTAFNNPLAGPSILGIQSGASLGVALVMLGFGGGMTMGITSAGGCLSVLLAAFAGAIAMTAVIFLFSHIVKSDVMLIIIGMMMSYVASSVIALLNFSATAEGVKSYMVWGLGNFSNVSSGQLPLFTAASIIGLALSLLIIKPLDTILLGERYASNLGIDVRRLRHYLILITGMLTAVTAAFCGPITFLGLAVPHLARLMLRTSNHRRLLPFTMLTGSAAALLCNLLCSLPSGGSLLPLNAVTPIVCAPVIIYVILKWHA